MPGVKILKWGEGRIETRTDARGRLRYRWRGPVRGERVNTKWYGKRSEALSAAEALLSPEEAVDAAESLQLGPWLALWLAELAPVGASGTDDNRQWAIDRLEPLHRTPLDELSTPMIEEFLRELARGRGALGRSSLIRIRLILGQALDAAIARRRMTAEYGNPARGAVIPRRAREPREGRTMTNEEAARFLEAAREDSLEAALVLMLWLGLRPGEALRLKWSELELEEARLDVVHAKVRSDRRLALPREVVSALRRQHRRQSQQKLRARRLWQETGLVVTSERGTAVDHANLRRAVRRVAEAAGLSWDPPPHSYELRHTAASLLVESGYPFEEVADLLGHKDARMLIETYRHRSKRVVDLRRGMRQAFGS